MFDKRLRDPAKSAAARERLRADVSGDGRLQTRMLSSKRYSRTSMPNASCSPASSRA